MNVALDSFFASDVEFAVNAALWWAMLGVKLFAAADALLRRDAFYVAADKQNKAFWVLMLVVFLALHVAVRFDALFILNLVGSVAAFVYLADVRPILRSMHQR